MQLETEFRLRLQLQQLEWTLLQSQSLPTPSPIAEPPPSTWVTVLNPPPGICSNEALLLCKGAGDRWIAWIPDYGKILLTPEAFNWPPIA